MSSTGEKLKVMTFNIRYDNNWDHDHSWTLRRQNVVNKIKEHQPDLLGVQEAMRHQVDYLLHMLDHYDYVGVGRGDGKDQDEFAAILYNKNRLTMLDNHTFWLSETPDKVGSMGWDSACTRICTWAKFEDKYTKKIFYHFNTHFDHEGEVAQVNSAKLILDQIKSVADQNPVIVMGDLNVTPDSMTYKTLTGQHTKDITHSTAFLRDVCIDEEGNPITKGTFSDFGRVSPFKIDYIFINNNIEVDHFIIDADNEEGIFTSDHFPIIADLKML
ncbi:endonuclease/exonuclease/phosphatase family protein [Vallitalea okinawensis]|uniref:endonuclease/exonuclease/phosphatase family protein n=1 Tax=Vallitalea okinawensis TaxID=2078660 RepID=UPI001478C292|nr:endonuclease/exonuclease/phosphatase family protein [Vallitalea okinawensis]